MKRCMYCGHENDDSASTCSVCGNKLGVSIPTVDAVVEEVSLDETPEVPQETPVPEDNVESAPAQESTDAEDEAMVTQEPAFAGQTPVNEQFAETTPGGQFSEEERPQPQQDGTLIYLCGQAGLLSPQERKRFPA